MTDRRVRDEYLTHAEFFDDAPQFPDTAEDRIPGHILSVCVRLGQKTHHAITDLPVILELLEQTDRGDPCPHDQRGHVVHTRDSKAPLETVEGHPARTLECKIQSHARENDEAPEVELPEEESDGTHHQKPQSRALEYALQLVDQCLHPLAAIQAEEPARQDPGQHDQRQRSHVGFERVDRPQCRNQCAPESIRAEPSERDQDAIRANVQAAHRGKIGSGNRVT